MPSEAKIKTSRLFRTVEQLQGDKPWGEMLDAGTGAKSLRWVSGLPLERWTAVTGSQSEADIARDAIEDAPNKNNRLIVGNWADENLLKGETFDTVLADYLVGAVEGFAPYFQSYLFRRLRPHVRGVMYITGLEPYVPMRRPETRAMRILWELGRFRDACVLLKGGMPYREYPSHWVVDQLGRSGFKVAHLTHTPNGYRGRTIKAQLHIALYGLDQHVDEDMYAALKKRGETLREEALEVIEQEGALRGTKNYVIEAESI